MNYWWLLSIIGLILPLFVVWRRWILPFKDYAYIRFTYTTEYGEIPGPWTKFEQDKVDKMFEIYEEMAEKGVQYLLVNDSKGETILLPSAIALKTTVKIETRTRFF